MLDSTTQGLGDHIADELTEKAELIKSSAVSHRAPVVAELIAAKRAQTLDLSAGNGTDALLRAPTLFQEAVEPVGKEQDLPHSPEKMAALSLATTLPKLESKDERFQAFLLEVTDPDFRALYPTFKQMAARYGVSVSTIKTWLLSKELQDMFRASLKKQALMKMPTVLESVALRAEISGDSHAATFVADMAGVRGRGVQDALGGIESQLKSIKELAISRKKTEDVIIDVESEDVE